MQYKKTEVEMKAKAESAPRGSEIAFKIMLTTMVFAILVTYFTK